MDRRDFLARAGTVLAGASLAGCSGGGGGRTGPPEGNAVAMVGATTPYYFNPPGLYVDPGTTVTFQNRSGTHTATPYADRVPEGGWSEGSDYLSGDETFAHTFEVEGTYDYYCQPHQGFGMVGRIVVGSPGGPAEGSDPPDGPVPDSQRIVEEGTVTHEEFG